LPFLSTDSDDVWLVDWLIDLVGGWVVRAFAGKGAIQASGSRICLPINSSSSPAMVCC
jgi:hypothetical protein